MNTPGRLRAFVVPSGDRFGLARVVVSVRVVVVLSVIVLAALGPDWMRRQPVALAVVLAGTLAYAAVVMARPNLEVRRTRYAWLVSLLDTGFSLVMIGLTGGVDSPVVAALTLVVIASAARLTLAECLGFAGLAGLGYFVVVLVSPAGGGSGLAAPVQGLWWALYLVFIALLSGALSVLLEREHQSRVKALVEAQAEHAAAEEERDLRARLLRSYEAQQEGLQVLLHEFRTPVASLDALTEALVSSEMGSADRESALKLAGRHARHLSDMLDSLADVNLSRQPAFSSGRVRRIDLAELIGEAGDAAGIRPPRLQISISGETSAIHVDAQGLRRVLTNLLENAARHGRGLPIDVVCECGGGHLSVAVSDRGPGVPQEDLGQLTTKFVRLSDRHGTAGLGLWIVAEIVDALGGTLRFTARDEGGLTASFTIPVN
ncbi:HAMP domain-containing histidine kinase [Mycolicibacterium austroafricanum]|uniref:histidine kinase n=1 Tax=Mycolicibacterium austroafricanum TaxID=39687 RepID=A0ABT8HPA5_MYCAO|nr:HAMP domain-containing sensor histidine kinase [Mycolicibacterium austroafricanum]MDN4522599.1 HAMP domain-containing sensor histidine kinase [Mycolicibacterium austroafricanum]PQP41532.1 sensor histidine kinase [Mycolicibacterium austroafricanum]QRZ07038.1 HAMP domain-containing histidine kinase [Mycolicibacterium austroafricanum]QZT68524.1 HAMP domain-containing histidine kinase [Mycolicibacterium austroafricanum]